MRAGSGWYDLTPDGRVIPIGRDFDEFLDWLDTEKAQGRIGDGYPSHRFHLRETVGKVDVSTVFLGLDHAFGDERGPVVLETMCFGAPMEDYCRRYVTLLDARFGHWRTKIAAREAQAWHREAGRRLSAAVEALWPIRQRLRLLCLLGLHQPWRGACTVCRRKLK